MALNFPIFQGDINKFLGRDLISDQFRPLGQQLGSPELSSGFRFQSGGNVFEVIDTGSGTRRLNNIGTVSALQAAEAQRQQQEQERKRAAFNEKLRSEESAFLNRFRTDFPNILTGIEEELGLPSLRQSAFTVGQDIQNIPEAVKQAVQGKDVSATQQARIEAAQRGERLPEFNNLLSALQFAEDEFGRRADRELVPFETEIGFMKDRFAREASGFSEDAQSRLNILLAQIQEEGANFRTMTAEQGDNFRAKLGQAAKLAELEENKRQFESSVSTVDLGDRIQLIDPSGNVIREEKKARLSSGSGGGGVLGGLTVGQALREELSSLGSTGGSNLAGDLNRDGVINALDRSLLLSMF